MIARIREWSNSPYEKPHGWRPYSEAGTLGRQPGAWHTRHDCDGMDETKGHHYGAVFGESLALFLMGLAEVALIIIAWLAGLVPHVLKWGAVTIVGLAIASAIAVAGIAIGVDMSYQDLINFVSGDLE